MNLPQVAECSNRIPRPIAKQYTAVACRSSVGTILREICRDQPVVKVTGQSKLISMYDI